MFIRHRIPSVLISASLLLFCSCAPSQAPRIAKTDEPFNIKANDELGIRLGTTLADFKQRYVPTYYGYCPLPNIDSGDCYIDKPNGVTVYCYRRDDGTSDCHISKLKGVTVAGAEISSCDFWFYNDRVIYFTYFLAASVNWQPLLSAFHEKFGGQNPGIIPKDMTWRNSLSTMSLRFVEEKDSVATSAFLELQLDKDMSDHGDKSREHEMRKAKDNL